MISSQTEYPIFHIRKVLSFELTYAGLVAASFVWGAINLALLLPTVADSPLPDVVFRSAFGTSACLYFASLTAYLIGQLLDIFIFGILRQLTGHRLLWLRSTGSTVLSQAIDSIMAMRRSSGVLQRGHKGNHTSAVVQAALRGDDDARRKPSEICSNPNSQIVGDDGGLGEDHFRVIADGEMQTP
jgi:hypothetical protein